MSLVSVIVPVYNTSERLKKCLDSLVSQTYKDIEIVLVNDGSSDDSGSICDLYSQRDTRVKTIHISNSGVSVARNIGLQHSISPYVMFVDSDDSVESILVERLLRKMLSEDLDFAICGYKREFIWNDKVESVHNIPCRPYTGNIIGFLEKLENYINIPLLQGPCWKIFKRSIIIDNDIKFPEKMSYGEDATFVYQYLIYVNNVGAIDESLYCYNIYGNKSLSRVFREDKYQINLFLIQKLKYLLKNHGITIDEVFFHTQVCDSYISYIGGISAYWNTIEKKIRYYYINKANNAPETKEAFRNLSKLSWQHKFLNELIINDKICNIDMYFIIKETIRRNFTYLYKSITKVLK